MGKIVSFRAFFCWWQTVAFLPLTILLLGTVNSGWRVVVVSHSVLTVIFSVLYIYIKRSSGIFLPTYLIAALLHCSVIIISVISVPPAEAVLIITFIFISALYLFRKWIFFKDTRNQLFDCSLKRKDIPSKKNVIFEYNFISSVLLYLLVFYLVIAFLFYIIYGVIVYKPIVYTYASLIGLIIIYEFIRSSLIMYKLSQEDWLAVVNERLDVVGIVSEEDSLANGNKYMHLEIRVVVISNNRVCLQSISRPGAHTVVDTPLATLLKYNETYDSAFKRVTEDLKKKPRFIMQYHHKTDDVDRIIRLYIAEVDDESLPEGLDNCRFWTRKQIEESMEYGHFSEFFKEEFEFLNSTVLPVIEMMSKKTSDE